MKRLMVAVLFTLSTAFLMPNAYAEDEEGDRECNNCQDNRGLRFTDSPVERSFNFIICLPNSTCNFEGQPQ